MPCLRSLLDSSSGAETSFPSPSPPFPPFPLSFRFPSPSLPFLFPSPSPPFPFPLSFLFPSQPPLSSSPPLHPLLPGLLLAESAGHRSGGTQPVEHRSVAFLLPEPQSLMSDIHKVWRIPGSTNHSEQMWPFSPYPLKMIRHRNYRVIPQVPLNN